MCFGALGSALINDVLDLSKIEAGRMELETVPFNLRKEVDSVFSLFDEKLEQSKKLEVFMLVHEAVPTCVIGDPGRFRQVLDNHWDHLILSSPYRRSAQHLPLTLHFCIF